MNNKFSVPHLAQSDQVPKSMPPTVKATPPPQLFLTIFDLFDLSFSYTLGTLFILFFNYALEASYLVRDETCSSPSWIFVPCEVSYSFSCSRGQLFSLFLGKRAVSLRWRSSCSTMNTVNLSFIHVLSINCDKFLHF